MKFIAFVLFVLAVAILSVQGLKNYHHHEHHSHFETKGKRCQNINGHVVCEEIHEHGGSDEPNESKRSHYSYEAPEQIEDGEFTIDV